MAVGYGQVLAVLTALHPDAQNGVVARLQYLQRKGFPIRAAGAARAEYGAEGLIKLALAFEVLAAGAPPGHLNRMVDEGWKSAARVLASAWSEPARRDALPIFVRIAGIGAKDDVGNLEGGTTVALRRWLQGEGSNERRILVVDAVRLMRAIAQIVSNDAMADLEDIIDQWARGIS